MGKSIDPLTIYERLRNAGMSEKAALELAKIFRDIIQIIQGYSVKEDTLTDINSEHKESIYN